MVTGRLLSRPPTGRTVQRSSWSCSSHSFVPKCAPKENAQNPSLESRNHILNGDASFTRASPGNRSTLFAGKVVTHAVVSQPVTSQGFNHVLTLWESVVGLVLSINPAQTQGYIERVIVDCRFFTFLAVAGSLLGSILCFVEGFVMVLQLYFRYLEAVLKKIDHGSILEILVEAIDMFLVGTAMLIFGMGLYAMFVGSKNMNRQRRPMKLSEMLPPWLKMESVSEAKTRIGHAVLMILQVGMLDKFKSVPLVTGSDLAYFSGAVLLSSASIFCLSKLSRSDA